MSVEVNIKHGDKEQYYYMEVIDKYNIIDKGISKIMGNLSEYPLDKFSIVNNNLLYEQLILRVLTDLFIKHMNELKTDYTYTVECMYNNDKYKFTVRDVTVSDHTGIKGIVYGLCIY